jgi:hypothetical protein
VLAVDQRRVGGSSDFAVDLMLVSAGSRSRSFRDC